MPHPEGCQCLDCLYWFQMMNKQMATTLPRGRHVCGYPIDDHRMTTKGEIVECPKTRSVQ